MVNGPGEAEVSTLGVTGAKTRSGFYEDGVRQKERLDNSNMIDLLEAKIRTKAAMLDGNLRININQLDK